MVAVAANIGDTDKQSSHIIVYSGLLGSLGWFVLYKANFVTLIRRCATHCSQFVVVDIL